MHISQIVRTLAAVASIALVAAALMGASWYSQDNAPRTHAPVVGTPTGEYVNGIEVQRLPSITVTARRSDATASK